MRNVRAPIPQRYGRLIDGGNNIGVANVAAVGDGAVDADNVVDAAQLRQALAASVASAAEDHDMRQALEISALEYEAERREAELRREVERCEIERREAERRETELREAKRRETELRASAQSQHVTSQLTDLRMRALLAAQKRAEENKPQ